MAFTTLTYEVDGRVARITLDRPERGNGITPELIRELVAAVEQADLDPAVHVVLLAGNGRGFCGGYDLVDSAERLSGAGGGERAAGAGGGGERAGGGASGERTDGAGSRAPAGSPLDPAVMAANHDPRRQWDPTVDFAMMHRNVRGFMSLMRADKPVVCKVHGFCVAGGTDLALCADLIVIAEDARIGYPPARVWGSPTTGLWARRIGAQRAARLLYTGDTLTGSEAVEWGLAVEAAAPDQLDARTEALVQRVALMPVNQLRMMKLVVTQSLLGGDLHGAQVLGTLLDGAARHTPEGFAFQQRAAREGFKAAVRERDAPFDG